MFPTSPSNSADVTAIKAVLESLPHGGVASYGDLSAALGRDIRPARWLLLRARRELEKDTGALFAAVRGVGLKRLSPSDAPQVGADATARIRRHASRAHSRLSLASNDMPDDARMRVAAYRSLFGTIAAISREKAVDAIATQGDVTPPTAVLLERLKGAL